METEAAERYGELATYMRRVGNAPTAAVLDALAAEERGHVAAVAGLSQASIGRLPDLADISWEGWPEVFDPEDLGTSRVLTPYQALSIAVRNEERAFAFWSYMSADAEDPAVRREAERMAREELQHVAKLRVERRRAFHEARGRPARTDPARFAAAAAESARALHALSAAIAARLEALGHPAADTMRSVAEQQALAARAAPAPAKPPPSDTAALTADASAEGLISLAVGRFEAAVEECFRAVEEIDDEGAIDLAQRLAEMRIRHLAVLRQWEVAPGTVAPTRPQR
jgi:rubrerythrin